MDESDCKLLTTFLGECWHEKPEESYHRQARKRFFLGHICGKCGKAYLNRTFTTPDDMMAVKDKLEEKGEWCGFTSYSYSKWRDYVLGLPPDKYKHEMSDDRCSYMFVWLLNPTRFCQLAADFLKGDKP